MKILEYAKNIKLEVLEQVARVIEDHPENEWHSVSTKFLHDPNIRSLFATMLIPIHNANGYQGNVAKFLWRANMDYYNLLPIETQTSEQPMQPQPTDYAAQLSAVKTLPELFAFRAKLKAELNSEVCAYMKVFVNATNESAQSPQITEIKFFIDRVESQIKALESNGVFLAAVDGRGAVRDSNDLIFEKSAAVAPWGFTPIEQKAKERGLTYELKYLQSLAKEGEWYYGSFPSLYNSGLVVQLGIYGEHSYYTMWRHGMDYINFLTKNPPKN